MKDAKGNAFMTWAQHLWTRMDRDRDGTLSRDELNCELFQDSIRTILGAAKPESLSVTYSRSEMHSEKALDWCMRKAIKHPNNLTFEDFVAFLKLLKTSHVDLVFALFDLDSSLAISIDEFREIYRYFNGREPKGDDIQREWELLDKEGSGSVTRSQYAEWFKETENPIFKRPASPIIDGIEDDAKETVATGKTLKKKQGTMSLPELLQWKSRSSATWRPPWNNRFGSEDPSQVNEDQVVSRRALFSKPHSLPQLARYYGKRGPNFEAQRQRFIDHREAPKPFAISCDVAPIIPERHVRGGTMRNTLGRKVPWLDEWQPPRSSSLQPRHRPGSLLLRCPTSPSPGLER